MRESGVLAGSPGCTITAPAAAWRLTQGCIIAKRHINDHVVAARFGVEDKEIVQVAWAASAP